MLCADPGEGNPEERGYVCKCDAHFAAWQKLGQRCKAIILQFCFILNIFHKISHRSLLVERRVKVRLEEKCMR